MSNLTCRPGTEPGVRLLDGRHVRDCNLSGCPGCAPCVPEHGHCHRCRRNHLDATHGLTCPSCVHEARNLIDEILEQTVEAHSQAIDQARVTSTAFALAVPAANYEAWTYVRQAAMSGALCKCAQRGHVCPADLPELEGPVCEGCLHEVCRLLRQIRRGRVCPDAAFVLEATKFDDLNPAAVLGSWDLTWRRHLDHDPAPDHAHVGTYGDYLLRQLSYMAQQPDTGFEDLVEDLKRCTNWLDAVLRTGKAPDQGEKCPACGKKRLIRDWDPDWRPGDDGTAHDLWVCPNAACAQTWTDEEYRARVGGIYLGVTPNLTASQIADQYRVPEGTVRRWAAAGLVRRRGYDGQRRQLYDRADIERQRDSQHATRTVGAAPAG